MIEIHIKTTLKVSFFTVRMAESKKQNQKKPKTKTKLNKKTKQK